MKTDLKMKRFNALHPFIQGFWSIFNISGPNTEEYLVLFESNSKKALQSNWGKVGNTIKQSLNTFNSKIHK